MKILYYSPHPQLSMHAPTGYGTHMREMVAAFRQNGVEVKTLVVGDMYQVTPPGASGTATNADEKDRMLRRKLRKLRSLIPKVIWETLKDLYLMRLDRGMQKTLRHAIAEYQPDVVYERVAYLQNSGIRVAAKMGVRHIAEINAPYPEERQYFSGRSFMLGAANKALLEVLLNTELVVTVSSALATHFEKMSRQVEHKTLVLPNAVNPIDAERDVEREQQLRLELGLSGALVFGFVGSIFPYHGVDLLIEAFAKLPKERAVKLLVVGDGESVSDLKALAQKLGVIADVVFTGSIPHRDVYLYIALMDVCCMAKSNWYGSPVKLFEYGLLGKAVIGPDVAPVRDVMDHNSALLVAPEVDALCGAMQLLMDDEKLRASIAQSWHLKVRNEHTWRHAAAKILDRCG